MVVVVLIRVEHAGKLPLIERDYVISALSSDGADDSFHIRVLPGAFVRRDDVFEAMVLEAPKVLIPVVQQDFW